VKALTELARLLKIRTGDACDARQIGARALGGPAAFRLTGQINSDTENARLRPNAPEAQLYNLDCDLSQKQNVIRQYPEKAIELSTGLSKIRSGHRTRP
jgi:arylsulfatase A